MINIYTDGACLLNMRGDLAIGLCGFYDSDLEIFVIDNTLSFDTTSYTMELKAMQMALENVKGDTTIFCDSMQVIDNLTSKAKKPKTETERQVRRFFELKSKVHNIDIQWVKAHTNNTGNNTIDQKLEQEMCRLIKAMKPAHRDMIIDRVRTRYQAKGCFESFSSEFFDRLLAN